MRTEYQPIESTAGLAEVAGALQAEVAAASGKPVVWLSDFDHTLCDTYTYDPVSNNHLAVIDPGVVAATAAHHVVIATSRRAANPTVPLLWRTGLLPAERPAIIENGGVIAHPAADGTLTCVDLVQPDQLKQLHGMPEVVHTAIRDIPAGQRLIFKAGRTMLLARLQDINGNAEPRHQAWLAEHLAALVPSGLQVTDTRASVTIQHESVSKDAAFAVYLSRAGLRREDIFVIGMGDGPNDAGIFAAADVSLGFSDAVSDMVDIPIPYGVAAIPLLFEAVRFTQTP